MVNARLTLPAPTRALVRSSDPAHCKLSPRSRRGGRADALSATAVPESAALMLPNIAGCRILDLRSLPHPAVTRRRPYSAAIATIVEAAASKTESLASQGLVNELGAVPLHDARPCFSCLRMHVRRIAGRTAFVAHEEFANSPAEEEDRATRACCAPYQRLRRDSRSTRRAGCRRADRPYRDRG